MNPDILAALGRERRRAIHADYARGDLLGVASRALLARVLRRLGEGLFRLGVALERRVPGDPVAETRSW